jgi:uncharacterized protein YcgI (DUF1989 family)
MRTVVPAGQGRAFRLEAHQRLRIGTIEGGQVVDTWALVPGSDEWLSMEHTRGGLLRVAPRAGDELFSNRRRAILRMTDDTSPGVHDTLIAACDQERYIQLGHQGPHRSCSDNFRAAVSEVGLIPPAVPSPLNLFMNVPIVTSGELSLAPSPARAGDEVTLEALVDLVVVVSACPQDMVPINGESMRPTDVEVHCPV